jgi:sarcosine oxidase subunit alpha
MTDAASATAAAGALVDPRRPLTFTFNGRPISALAGQSIAAALYAAGQRIFTRSFKYHRPRGLFCVAGDCPNCLMQVDGCPNVRTCVEPARAGQVVRHQNAWPSLDFDVLRVFDRIDRLLPVGFYYKHFHKPRWLWPIFEHTVRHIAGLGRIDVNTVPETDAAIEFIHSEVCVIGAGPAGLAAATAAADAGAKVLLLDRQPRPGGHLLYTGGGFTEEAPYAAALHHPRVQLLSDTVAFGLYEGNMLGAFHGSRFLKIRAKQTVVCTGGRELPFVFHNNDLPGIFPARGVLRLARLYGVRAGRRAVVLTDGEAGARVAKELTDVGIEVAAVVNVGCSQGDAGGETPWPVHRLGIVVGARGSPHLQAITVAEVSGDGDMLDQTSDIDCDLMCMASRLVPANELLLQAGMRFQHKEGYWQPAQGGPGLFAAGAAAGTRDLDAQVLEGGMRGAEAAAALGYSVPALDEYQRQWQAQAARAAAAPTRFLPAARLRDRKRFLCLCEDVTEKDIHEAVAEGFDNIETLKRYSTASMGPCQGKICGPAMSEACARATGWGLAAAGMTTSRPPAVPVEMCVLAAGRHHPVRRTPVHHWHATHGARWMDAGQWKRPESYGDPAAEVQGVRNGVGLIDVSTLGKIELIGPDAVELLERICLNRWTDLKAGRARYGAMCNEDGILFDDGVGARVGPDHFYITATTGNAEAVVQWLELWQATWRLNVTVLNHTGSTAAMNLAGPRAREVLGKLTSLDVSPAAFPYMAVREAEVAAVSCRLLRIGFVGELGYEIHCPSNQAWHLWEALVEAGTPLGLRPFGVEAQRILRLEKGHLIIGQDTDALSTPLEAGLEWMVRFDKPMFHGRAPLLRLKDMSARSRLVGFMMTDATKVPPEGCQVVEQNRPAGRVTSSRFSPTLGRSLGLAWVPAARSAPGTQFLIRSEDGSDMPAQIVSLPFYDPDGKRLKS